MKEESFKERKEKLLKALEKAFEELVQKKKKENKKLVIERDGKVVHVDPDDI